MEGPLFLEFYLMAPKAFLEESGGLTLATSCRICHTQRTGEPGSSKSLFPNVVQWEVSLVLRPTPSQHFSKFPSAPLLGSFILTHDDFSYVDMCLVYDPGLP